MINALYAKCEPVCICSTWSKIKKSWPSASAAENGLKSRLA